jgi:MFS superfamily sulfate permease-like transporter
MYQSVFRSYRRWLPMVLLAVSIVPVQAQNVEEVATSFFGDLQQVLQGIALAAAAVSLLTLGLIYLLSTWPPVAQYKAQHPDLMQNIIIGLLIILFVSGGTLAGLIAFQ